MAKEKTIILNVETEKAQDNIQDLTKDVKKLGKEVDKVGDDASKDMGKLEDSSKGATKGVNKVGGAFKKLGVAIKAAGIGLIVSAFAAIGSIAAGTQDAIDGVSTSMTFLQLLFNDIVSGGEKFKQANSIADYFAEITKESKAATAQLNAAKIAQAQVTQETLKAEIAAEKLRQTRDDITKSYRERVHASTDLSVELKYQGEETKKLAQINLDAAQAAYDRNKTVENEVALIEAKTALLETENKVVTALSEQQAAHNALMQEAIQFKQEYGLVSGEDIISEFQTGEFTEDAEIELELARSERLIEIAQDRIDTINENEQISNEEKIRQTQEYYKEINDLSRNNVKLEGRLQRVKTDMVIGAAQDIAYALSTFAKEGSDMQKKFAITGVVIDAAAAIIGTWRGYASFGPYGTIAAAAQTLGIVATAVKQISTISNAESGAVSGSVTPSTPEPQAPAFNVVGASDTNQLAQTINERDTQPVKAYVVGSEVSSQQALDRNTVENATVV